MAEQKALIRPIIRLLKDYKVVVIGDREFRSVELASWLEHKRIGFALRLKQGTYIKPEGQDYQRLSSLGKELGRADRRHSSFWIGLYGQVWVAGIEVLSDLVGQLMKMKCNKLPFFQRGLRAMALIQSTF